MSCVLLPETVLKTGSCVAQARLKHSVALNVLFQTFPLCVSTYVCHNIRVKDIGQLTGVGSFHHVGSRGLVEHVHLLTAPTLLKKQTNQTAAPETVFTLIHYPTFWKGLGKTSPSAVCRVSRRKRNRRGDRWEALKATADSTLVCHLLSTIGWDCRCALHIWLYMRVDLNDCTCVASEE